MPIELFQHLEVGASHDASNMEMKTRIDKLQAASAVETSEAVRPLPDLTESPQNGDEESNESLEQPNFEKFNLWALGPRNSVSSESSEDLVLFEGRKLARDVKSYEKRASEAAVYPISKNPSPLLHVSKLSASQENNHEHEASNLGTPAANTPAYSCKSDTDNDNELEVPRKERLTERPSKQDQRSLNESSHMYLAKIRPWSRQNETEISARDDSEGICESCGNSEKLLDEDDLHERQQDSITDEQLAYSLSKQLEMALDSDEIFLPDDEDGLSQKNGTKTDERGLSEKQEANRIGGDFHGHHNRYKRSVCHEKLKSPGISGKIRGVITYPRLDDQNRGEFDFMDRDRASISKGHRNSQGAYLGFELSDSELEESLYAAWVKDRKKKRVRKMKREEARAQGLLSDNSKRLISYGKSLFLDEMGMEEFRSAIKEFLTGEEESFALPPMDKQNRKVIHEIANKFNIKSSSKGSGRNRFPVLYKTRNTLEFDEELFENLKARHRRFLLNSDNKSNSRISLPKHGSMKAKGIRSPSYIEGEIVGAAAPELSSNNRGRAMLEKMGWSTGTALGTANNKGILQPVVHVVKRSKAGLG